MKKIKVLNVTGVTPGGGVYTFLRNIELYSDKNQFDMHYIFSRDENTSFFLNSFPSDNINILPSTKMRNLYSFFKELICFYKDNSSSIDVIHIHSPNIALPHLLFSKLYGIKVRTLHSHNTRHADVFHKKIRNYFLSAFNNSLINSRLACSNVAGRFLFGKKFFTIIKNGIDLSVFKFNIERRNIVRSALNFDKNKVYGHVGGFLPQKNHVFLLKIFSEIIKKEPESRMLLIGDGFLREKIEKEVSNLGIEKKVYFLGQRDDVADLIQGMDVFLFPSVFEGLGFVAIEAQASGLTCFVSEQIPEEARVTNLINYLPLTKSAIEWSNLIISHTLYLPHREKYYLSVKNAGYDVHDCVRNLQNFYISQLRKNNG
ncbi:glycosyltransferase [Pectobacterium fontis]|uniref:glycosyltransferase n=1 Tax=Pectobacterium fontis TaxID=2558042 RepID=UPI00068B2A40|nr:glycosyltransferase [Pectobacterium fontis]